MVAPSGSEIISLKICKTSKILSASSPYKIEFTLSKLELIIKLNLAKALGILPSISLNSFMKGGNTRTEDINRNRDKNIITIRRDIDLGNFNLVLI